jgi:hypothetical protein
MSRWKKAKPQSTSLFDVKKEKKVTAPKCKHCKQYAFFGIRGEMFCRTHVPADFWHINEKPQAQQKQA